MKYKRVDAKNGRIMFYADGKMVSKEDIAIEVLEQLHANSELEIDAPLKEEHFEKSEEKLIDRKVCIFKHKEPEAAVTERYINEQLVGLCAEHRHGKTLGEIAEAVRNQ